jgi:retron-type reverse transcriptase
MKRIGNLYEKIYSLENLELADKKARKNKRVRYGIIKFDRQREKNLKDLSNSLKNRTYHTSKYDIFRMIVDSGKEREIYRLPYYPDRICHHAVMNVIEQIFVNSFTTDTYSCIKGRGIHGAFKKIKKTLIRNQADTTYCLKMDVRKFYPSIDHNILKTLIRKKIKDNDLLWLLDEIIDSAPGIPIGNYLSQFFANIYLTYFDHWLKETKQVKYYYRYCDDLVILHADKIYLHRLRLDIDQYIRTELNLVIKDNWQVFPVEKRSIDFLGYRFYHTHILLRKSIKKRFAHKVAKMKTTNDSFLRTTQSAYWGWAKHANCKHLLKKLSI